MALIGWLLPRPRQRHRRVENSPRARGRLEGQRPADPAQQGIAEVDHGDLHLGRSSVLGHRTRITISFQAATDLYGTPVTLSVSGLPCGVTASFSPYGRDVVGD